MVRVASDQSFWIFTELFFPDETSSGYYLTEIAKHFSKNIPVQVVCGPTGYEKKSKQKSKKKSLGGNIKIHRVWAPKLDKNNAILRLVRLLLLTMNFSLKLIFNVKAKSKVLVVTNPAFFIPAASFIAKIKKYELIILVHDVFPENLIPIKATKPESIIYKLNLKIFNWAYRNSSKIIVLGRDMKLLFEQKIGSNCNKIDVIENWADISEVENNNLMVVKTIYKMPDLKNKIIIQFAGNMGRLQSLDTIIDLAQNCKNTLVHFVLIGEGALKNDLLEASKNLSNLLILDSFARDHQKLYLNACDIGLVTLNDEMLGLGVPSKTYNLMAAGKPILYLGNKNSEIALLINEHEIGWSFETSNKSQILDFLNNLSFNALNNLKTNSKNVAEKYYSKEIILSKYNKYLNA